mmetsp:Transcript_17564/g.49612  ORF Transcript_17564/g.49612 Transcript_17564/m.49612 type:complete len:90 (-) Transcript_17564:28-297(-)
MIWNSNNTEQACWMLCYIKCGIRRRRYCRNGESRSSSNTDGSSVHSSAANQTKQPNRNQLQKSKQKKTEMAFESSPEFYDRMRQLRNEV